MKIQLRKRFVALLPKLSISFVLVFLLAGAFATLAEQVRDGDTTSFDNAVLLTINQFSDHGLDQFFLFITHFGDKLFVIIITALLLCMSLWHKRYFTTAFITASIGGAALLNILLKLTFQRQRPELWQLLVHESSFSFPSGHAMASCALAVCLYYLYRDRHKITALVLGIGYVCVIGLSRLYLGVHFPTDVLGGWLVSTSWVVMCASIFNQHVSSGTMMHKRHAKKEK